MLKQERERSLVLPQLRTRPWASGILLLPGGLINSDQLLLSVRPMILPVEYQPLFAGQDRSERRHIRQRVKMTRNRPSCRFALVVTNEHELSNAF
jgi:hypothetical protein